MDTNVWKLSEEERRKYQMDTLPANLAEAVAELERDDMLKAALGDQVFSHFVQVKKEEWGEYIAQVTNWEMEAYLATY